MEPRLQIAYWLIGLLAIVAAHGVGRMVWKRTQHRRRMRGSAAFYYKSR